MNFGSGLGGMGTGAAAGGVSSSIGSSGGYLEFLKQLMGSIGSQQQGGEAAEAPAANPGSAGSGQGAATIRNLAIGGDKIGRALTAPDAARRAYVVDLAGDFTHLGQGIQPVASSAGGAAMVRAMRENRSDLNTEAARDAYMRLGQKIRQANAEGGIAKGSTSILMSLLSMYGGGGGLGGGGGGAAAGGGGGMAGI